MFLNNIKPATQARPLPINRMVSHIVSMVEKRDEQLYSLVQEYFENGYYINPSTIIRLSGKTVSNELKLVLEMQLANAKKAKMKLSQATGMFDSLLIPYAKSYEPFEAREYRLPGNPPATSVTLHSSGMHVISVAMPSHVTPGLPGRVTLYDARLYRTVYRFWPDAELRMGHDKLANSLFCAWYMPEYKKPVAVLTSLN